MIFALKEKVRKNKKFIELIRGIATPFFYIEWGISNVAGKLRRGGLPSKRYQWIKELKNTHCGERCFVVATGPSLTMEDLELIRKEYCVSMNSCIFALEKTEWKPDLYMIQDEYVYKKLQKDLNKVLDKLDFVIATSNINRSFRLNHKFRILPLNRMDKKIKSKMQNGVFKYSDDCYADIYDNGSVIFTVFQLICYMGFKEIYILGCDCDYGQDKTHFIDYGYKDIYADIAIKRIMQAHLAFKNYADKHGIRVVNCTRGGKLEVYIRKSLEDVVYI